MGARKDDWNKIGLNDRSFLLHCWQDQEPAGGEGPGHISQWRFALTGFGERPLSKGFASLEDVVTFLTEELARQRVNNDRAG
jgi:hypothetical protein